jgi:methionyl-tRNA formyltransferase
MAQRIVYFGNERIATGITTTAPVLSGLIAAGYEVAALILSRRPTTSRSAKQLEIEVIAESNSIPILYTSRPVDIFAEIVALKADIGVLVAYGQLIPKSVIDVFPCGIVNIHPSLLPALRGSTPVETTIQMGNKYTGCSLMSLTPTMDAGPIWSQEKLPLTGQETKQELADKLLKLGAKQLINILPAILDHTKEPLPQNNSVATYTRKIDKSDGILDWTRTAIELERQIRAYSGWPSSKMILAGMEIIVLSAHISEGPAAPQGTITTNDGTIKVATSTEWLEIDQLKPAGSRAMATSEYLRGRTGHI